MVALTETGQLPKPDDVRGWVAVMYLAAIRYYSGMASPAEVDEALAEAWKWGTAAHPDIESWGDDAASKGGMSAVLDAINEG